MTIKKMVFGVTFALLAISTLVSAARIQQVKTKPELPITDAMDSKLPIVASTCGDIPEEVRLIPEYPYPDDEVNVIISFILNQAHAEYTLAQEGNTFNIYVGIYRTWTPWVRRVVLNVSLGQLPIGSYQVNIKGVYYPRIITFTVDSAHVINHFVEIYGYPFRITIESNSTISAFVVNLEEKQISFSVSRQDDTVGFCNVTVPKLLLEGDFEILIDEVPICYTLTQNDTHSFLYFVYSHSMDTVEIVGTIVAEPPLPKIFRVPDVNPTIQEAVDTANQGDMIRVRAGTYYENLLVDKTVSLVGENQTMTIIDGESEWYYYSVIVVLAQNVTLNGFTIENGLQGILIGADGCNISHNVITNNFQGITLSGSNNTISGNIITQNVRTGIWAENGAGNKIYHNNFINVYDEQALVYPEWGMITWDDGYPSGGNYWSDYVGIDQESGVYQNETGSDGIGDSFYQINGANKDNYPFIAPINLFDAGVWNGTLCKAQVATNSTVSNFQLDETEKIISFSVTGENGLGFCRAAIPNVIVQDMWQGNYTVLVDSEPPLEIRNWTDNTNMYIYFTYEHSEHKVTIVPEFPSLIILPLFMIATLLTVIVHKTKHSIASKCEELIRISGKA